MTESPRGLPIREIIPIKGIRKVMARSMKASTDRAALSQISREIDVSALQDLRKDKFSDHESRISLNSMMMVAAARTLPRHPLLNAELNDNNILVYDAVNLGIAVATSEGLVVVVVPEADSLSIKDMAASIESLAERARSGSLSIEDVEGGTFTASNLGMYGVDGGFPIPRSSEGAILLIGAARDKPVAFQGAVSVRQIACFSLTFDHRFIDGATAAVFLKDLNDLVACPESLEITP